jgi:hypothetical protein
VVLSLFKVVLGLSAQEVLPPLGVDFKAAPGQEVLPFLKAEPLHQVMVVLSLFRVAQLPLELVERSLFEVVQELEVPQQEAT